jgi:hypothetical protein
MTRYPWILLLALALAACGDDAAGNDPGEGGSGGEGGGGCTQAECQVRTNNYWEVEKICVAGECQDAGLKDEFNETIRGAMLVSVKSRGVDARNIHSGHARIFFPQDARGEAVDCARILATPDRYHRELNVVGYYTTAIRSEGYRDLRTVFGPVAGLPVNDASTPYLVYVGLYAGDRDPTTKNPTGDLLAEGCKEGMIVAPGEPEDWYHPDPAHMFEGPDAGPVAAEE